MSNEDALIGLRFEVSGGLGRMTGRIIGKAAHLYLVQKTGAEHFELLELEDLRSAKFFADLPVASAEAEAPPAAPAEPSMRRRLSDQLRRQIGSKSG
jgi:hypothetical protein